MGRRGRKRRLDLESEYWRLLSAGMGTVEVCRELGIGRKAGFRWRQENGGLGPPRPPEEGHSGRYLSRFERQRIATLVERGHGVREIARRIGRSASTVSRELHRNRAPHDHGGHDGDLAHARARERARRPKAARLSLDPEFRHVVADKLTLEWSPEQISSYLRLTFPEQPDWHLCTESIYQALYLPGRGGLSRELTKKLRTGRPMRKRHRRSDQRRSRFANPGLSIAKRPLHVEAREHPGHWEGDLIVGHHNRSAIGTIVERKSRFVRLVHLPIGHGADELFESLTETMANVPRHLRLTLTWDQGSEMARHGDFTELFGAGVYFADPGSPWQRGTNENTNGLLRQYFPKGTDLSAHSISVLRTVEERINSRPRKILGWSTPAAVLSGFMSL
jgi:IS30 family transposase